MPFVLRIDVDKPYGNHTLIRKLASKFFEETGFNPLKTGYLDHLREFLSILNERNIKAVFYFRICSIPSPQLLQEMQVKGHAIGWHLENSRNYETFEMELREFRNISGVTPHSFTKHGSGTRKLGRYHYPAYEPDKYQVWAKESGVPFYFGNGLLNEQSGSDGKFFADAFWIEDNYRDPEFNTIEKAISKAQTEIVPILTHPENIVRNESFRNQLIQLIEMSKQQNIQWSLL